MRVLVVGSGGREHALAWTLRDASALFIAPGNAGTAAVGQNIPVQTSDFAGLVGFARSESVDLTVVGPEVPLADGLADAMADAGIAVFGPSAAAAEIESSKAFAKGLMRRCGVPTAEWQVFDQKSIEEANAFVQSKDDGCVVKVSGLAAGKGAIICEDSMQAVTVLHSILVGGTFGDAGQTVVVEERMKGQEASVFALTDGEDYVLLDTAQDHKRALDGDLGPNTGGMGAYAPAALVTEAMLDEVCKTIIEPTLAGMASEGRLYRGCLYVGLMLTDDGPKVVEYNCRLGDPEAQAVLPLLDVDALDLFMRGATGGIGSIRVKSSGRSAACVVMASGGYPGAYKTGHAIAGLDEARKLEGIEVFHAGTRAEKGRILTAGGRVLGVTAVQSTLTKALDQAYAAADCIHWEGVHMRRDIGYWATQNL